MKKLIPAFIISILSYSYCAAQFVPDPSFGSGGHAVFNSIEAPSFENAIAIQSDGKILVSTGGDSLALGRLNTDGTIDNTFGINGWAHLNQFSISDMLIQPDGKIVGIGLRTNITYGEAYVWRYNQNGTPDNTFGTNGRTVDTALGSGYTRIAIQDNAHYILSGTKAIKRIDTTGAIDHTFGTNGYVSISSLPIFVTSLVVEPGTSRIILGGYTKQNSNIAVMRLMPDGAMSGGFGVYGIDSIPYMAAGLSPELRIKQNSTGKIILATDYLTGGLNKVICAQFNTDGSLDNAFGTGGIAVEFFHDNTHNTIFGDMAIQPDDKIILSANSFTGIEDVTSAIRLDTNGTADAAFGQPVPFIQASGGTSTDIAVDADGKVVITGSTYQQFAVARIEQGATPVQNVVAANTFIATYPNPAASYVYVEMPAQGNYELQLRSGTGQLINTKQTTQKEILNTENLPSGIYFITATDKQSGERLAMQKVSVVH